MLIYALCYYYAMMVGKASNKMALNPQQTRVAELTAAGCNPSQIASATGFSLSYISQLGAMEEFQALVVVQSGVRIEAEVERQDGYDSLEGVLLQQMESMAGSAELNELSRALDVVAKNNPKRGKLGGNGVGAGDTNVAVTVVLPQHVLQPLDIVVNARNEVIELGGTQMSPLTTKEIRSRLAQVSVDSKDYAHGG